MSTQKNKVKFGLRNVHYAPLTVGSDGTLTYATPKPWPGAVNLSMDPQGEVVKFFADDGAYFVDSVNNGYEGDLETALVPDDFRKDVLGEFEDANGVLLDDCDAVAVPFALLFEFQGDKHARRHVLYNCTATRPGIGSATKEESLEVQTETTTITASPIKLPTVDRTATKATLEDSTKQAYQDWYSAVYEPQAVSGSGSGTSTGV